MLLQSQGTTRRAKHGEPLPSCPNGAACLVFVERREVRCPLYKFEPGVFNEIPLCLMSERNA